ncbi:MAG TPA: ArsC family reductase [Rheinheimera sp.]|nr:ArsC family reductase [Rheinheimera sp.]
MFVMYGIKNCDTIKKARQHLDALQKPYQFHDYRVDGLSEALLDEMLQVLDWQQLLNTRGTTFRALPDADKTDLTQQKARALMLAQPAMIKRPVLRTATGWLLGYQQDTYQQL